MGENEAAGQDNRRLRTLRRIFRSSSHVRPQPPSRAQSVAASVEESDSRPAVTSVSSSIPAGKRNISDDTLNAPSIQGQPVTLPIRLSQRLDGKLDDNKHALSNVRADINTTLVAVEVQHQESRRFGPETNTAKADNTQEDDMWTIAEAQLRRDKKANKILDAYTEILKSKLKDIDSPSILERQRQISAFIESESKKFQDTRTRGICSNVLKKASECVIKAQKVISAASQPFLPASVACAGVILVLSVSPP